MHLAIAGILGIMPATPLPLDSALAVIQTQDGWTYQLTPTDVLWAARAAARESPREAPLVLWAFTQRAAWYMPRKGMSFVGVLRSFSQPINPIWARDGENCRPGGPYAGRSECAEKLLQARDWYANASWDDLAREHPGVVDVTQAWARGLIDNLVPRVTNFAAPTKARNYLAANTTSTLFYAGENWYVIDPGPASWPDNFVGMRSASGAIATTAPRSTVGAVITAFWNGATQWWRGV